MTAAEFGRGYPHAFDPHREDPARCAVCGGPREHRPHDPALRAGRLYEIVPPVAFRDGDEVAELRLGPGDVVEVEVRRRTGRREAFRAYPR